MEFWQHVDQLLGLHKEAQDLTFSMMALRAVIMFFAVLIMLRVAEKRFTSGRNTLDKLLVFLLASVLARAINGSERFFETIGTGFILVFLHRLLALVTCRHHGLGKLIKGKSEVLVEDGAMKKETMDRLHLSEHDLQEDLRLKTGSDDIQEVERAQLERNGEISVKPKK